MIRTVLANHAHAATRSGFYLTNTEVTLRVPIGVVLAALISFLALRWSTNKTVTNQQETLTMTLASQERVNLETLKTQRELAQDEAARIERWPARNDCGLRGRPSTSRLCAMP